MLPLPGFPATKEVSQLQLAQRDGCFVPYALCRGALFAAICCNLCCIAWCFDALCCTCTDFALRIGFTCGQMGLVTCLTLTETVALCRCLGVKGRTLCVTRLLDSVCAVICCKHCS